MEFSRCESPTVGVEWELQLLDRDTLDLSPGIMPLMEFFPERDFIKPEFVQSCVELNSCIAQTSDGAVQHISRTLRKTLSRAEELGMTACGAGTHPFCRRLALITPTPRYRALEKTSGYLAHNQITFSTHVHIGMESGDQAMRVMSRLIPALPAFIALSANSPFWRGHETGHVAYRHRILAAAPNYGLPISFDSWADFEKFFDAAANARVLRHFKDIHWGIRPHPDFGTLEIRSMDAASDLESLHGLVSFARSMAIVASRMADDELNRLLPADLPEWIASENCYRASHHGLEAEFICSEHGQHRPLIGVIDELLALCRSAAAESGEERGLLHAADILAGRTGYGRQLASFSDADSTVAVVADLRQQLLAPAPAVEPLTAHRNHGQRSDAR